MIKYPLYVTLDTNIFVANKFDFGEDSPLGLLGKYVANGKIKVVISNIVIKEVEKHIIAESNKVCGELRSLRSEVLKTASEGYLKQVGLDTLLQILDKKVYMKKSQEVWKQFIGLLNPEILDNSKIDLDTIISDYFDIKPPFENNDRKRKEFPDAFIANQIRERFEISDVVAIISKDKGFCGACGNSKNHIFFETLGGLYDAMNREEAEYKLIVQKIDTLISGYIAEMESMVMEDGCVEVDDLICDKDGIVEGFDYNETAVMSIKNTTCKVRTIDEITDEKVWATLLCRADIEVECSYEDYYNAAWDHETETYFYLETRKNLEKHTARFGIRIEVNRKEEYFRILPFKVILNGDTLCDRFEIEENDCDYEMDVINQDREELGFCSLDHYDDFLEDKLLGSSFYLSVISVFEEINSLYQEYEDIATVYDEFVMSIKESKPKDVIKQLAIKLSGDDTFPVPNDLDSITDEDMDEINGWADQSYERLSDLSEQSSLPDRFNYGDTIEISNGEECFILVVGELFGTPSAGDEELIDLSIKDKAGSVIVRGYVKLTVGYLNFDEEGGAGDGIEDDLEYCCDDIIRALENIAASVKNNVEKEWTVANIVKTVV